MAELADAYQALGRNDLALQEFRNLSELFSSGRELVFAPFSWKARADETILRLGGGGKLK